MKILHTFIFLAIIAALIFTVMVFHRQPKGVPDELITKDTAYTPYDESKMPLTAKY